MNQSILTDKPTQLKNSKEHRYGNAIVKRIAASKNKK